MADELGFRVCVDAREVCKDIRSCFFIYVDLLRDRYIHDIESRVKSFLNVDKPIALVIDRIYVPPSENVRLLCPDDVLKVTERSWDFHDDRENANAPCKEDNSDHNRIYLKEKIKKRKRNASGDVDDSCSAVNKSVHGCEPLQNLYESDKYPKDKDKKRKRKSKDNRSHVSSELCSMEQLRCEVVVEDIQHLVQEEEGMDRKICRRKQNGEDALNDDVSDPIMNVKRTSEHIITRPDIPVRESQENSVSNLKMGINAETVQDNECLMTRETGTKSRRKRTRRHKKNHKLEDRKMKRESSADIVNPKRETFIRSVAAPRTHIRFSDKNGDVSIDVGNDKVETDRITSQTECEHTCTSHVSGGLTILEPLVTSTNVDAVSSDLNLREVGKLKHLSSDQQTSTKWDMQAVDNSQCGDLQCSGSSGNNHVFAKLLAFENFSAPRVYQRKKNLVTADGAIQETLSNADVESRDEIKTADKKTNFLEYPVLKEAPKEKDIIAFKMLKMGEDYTPQISDYITAQVLSICKETYQLMLKILVSGNYRW
ncbi:hypothetical protein B7P43_G07105 [Cryptotermes secundus]|uniref:Coilin tudor domain-containing protein n=1 Tax=Cryptotermes secundus TaxID=105785 RepID=A0A2J7Q254_9NEOP|nr:hypothetical protein B7P43_G07105 [Cryptotermes secundus]